MGDRMKIYRKDFDKNTEEGINCLDALQNCIAFDSKDFSLNKRDAWIYGIVLGWNDICLETSSKYCQSRILEFKTQLEN